MKGFTLLEIILVLVLVPLFFSLLAYGFLDIYQRYLLKTEKDLLVSLLLRARDRALINYLGLPHGVSWQDSTKYLVFVGTSSQQRITQYDEYFVKSNASIVSAPFTEIVFWPLSLKTNASGTIYISVQNKNASIEINNEGRINY